MIGILNFLSLSNLMQFGSLLWSERYEDEEEDNALDALYNDDRTAAESILHWLDAAIVVKCGTVTGNIFTSANDPRVPNDEKHSVEAIRDSYLCQQLLALSRAMDDLLNMMDI
ncbi:hypothetical protein AAF712_015957, partial [Marasmius tenuissimus]